MKLVGKESAGFVYAKPLTRLRKVRSGVYEPEFLHPDGTYRSKPPDDWQALINQASRLDG
jgi:hypothetical protein